MQKNLCEYQGAYTSLRQSLAKVGWISEGYVQDRGPGAGGPHYQWTRKVRAKTVSVALSKEQYEWLHQAIANWRQVQQIIKEMQRLSRRVLFETVPHPPRRKRLGKKVLGLI
jgi:cyclopropane fatty-acyl-phospholipid synthase-like methyltransferase